MHPDLIEVKRADIEIKKQSLWARDMTVVIFEDLDSLDIDAKIYHGAAGLIIYFKSQEDMNLYKLVGKYVENYYLLFVTDMSIFK